MVDIGKDEQQTAGTPSDEADELSTGETADGAPFKVGGNYFVRSDGDLNAFMSAIVADLKRP